MEHFLWEELEKQEGVYHPRVGRGGTLTGETIEVSRVFYPAGHRPGHHSHANEQIITVLSGLLRVTIDGDQTFEAGTGTVFRFPSNIPHNVEVIEDTVFLSLKNLVDGQGSAGPRVWYEPPPGGSLEG